MKAIADLPAHEVLRRQANAVLALAQPVVALDGSGYYGIPSTELDEVAVRLGLEPFSRLPAHPTTALGRGAGRTTLALVAAVAHVLRGKPTVFVAEQRTYVRQTLLRWSRRVPEAGRFHVWERARDPWMMLDKFRPFQRNAVFLWDHQAVEGFRSAVEKRIREIAALSESGQ